MNDIKNSKKKLTRIFSKGQSRKQKKFLIVGAGRFGNALINELINLGQYVVVIDKDQEKINTIGKKVDLALIVDATNENQLSDNVNFTSIDHCIVSTGSNVSDSFIIVWNLLKFLKNDYTKLSVKAFNDRQQSILKSMGVNNFIRTEKTMARNQALGLVYKKVNNLIDVAKDIACYQVKIKNSAVEGKTIKWLNEKYNIKVAFVVTKGEITLAENSHQLQRMQTLIIVSSFDIIYNLSKFLTEVPKEV